MGVFSYLTVAVAENLMQHALKKQLKINTIKEFKPRLEPENKIYLLYIHVPFCHTFCPYCSFHKYKYNEEVAINYFKHLRMELKKVKEEGFIFDTVYVGGGTTLINESELIKTLELVKNLFNVDEISCETDPSHIEKESLKRYKGLIKRLSIGVQSFDDDILKRMGRYQKFGGGEKLKERISEAMGILPIVSLDLIFNFPMQNKEMLIKDLQITKSIKPEQITTYPLMSSAMTKKSIEKSFGKKEKNNEYKFYQIIQQELRDYNQNNAWSFSKKTTDMKDEYVGSYHEYVGVGSGAFSFLRNTLFVNTFNLNEYAKNISKYGSSYMAECSFSKIDQMKYLFLTALFDGKVDIAFFNKIYNVNLEDLLYKEIKMLTIAKAIIIKNGIIYSTDYGRYLCVVMMREFYSGMDRVRAMFKEPNP